MQKNKTIGVLVGGISDDFSIALCRGVIDQAKKANVNVIVFPCKYIQRDFSDNPQIQYEYQFETVVSLIRKENLDGIITALDCLGCFATTQFKKEFMEQFSHIPCILAASYMEGFSGVTFDNATGIRDGVNYMVQELGLTKIGMISGPESNHEASLRKQAFLQALSENHIACPPERIVKSGMARYDTEAFKSILDNNPDIQGIFCLNDETAFGLYEEMKKRDLLPGKDISVFGYDNTDWASQIYPTLSSVDASPTEIGATCVNALLKKMNGEFVSNITLSTKFVLRNSFVKSHNTSDLQEIPREDYVYMNRRLNEQIRKESQHDFDTKHYIRNMLQFEHGNDYSYAHFFQHMNWLKIEHAYLFLYPNPLIHLQSESFRSPDTILLKCYKKGQKITVLPGLKQSFSINNLFDSNYLELSEQFSFVFLPLYSNENLFGFFLCDLTKEVCDNGEFLSSLMSNAVKMIYLLQTNELIQKQLEESLALLKENNVALNTISKTDPMTGILNRRGYFESAEKLISIAKERNLSVLLLYVDMNNLKIINDKYGHQNGDYSLCSIARILSDSLPPDSIVGRIGGDEFSCALITEDVPDTVVQRILVAFDQFNRSSDKEYMVTVSIGSYLFSAEETISLQDGLSLADEKLYLAKKNRTKEVSKDILL